jgi:hypothetical protein
MLAICMIESNGVATATNWNDSHIGCNGSFGLLQVGCLHGVAREDLYNPVVNIRVAYHIYKEQGLDAWRTSYRKLLAHN